jgi:hypothetical protein
MGGASGVNPSHPSHPSSATDHLDSPRLATLLAACKVDLLVKKPPLASYLVILRPLAPLWISDMHKGLEADLQPCLRRCPCTILHTRNLEVRRRRPCFLVYRA